MKTLKLILFILIFAILQIYAQSISEINDLQNHYEAFEYSTVITKADNLLLDKERFSDESLIQILSLKAASQYAMSELEDSRKTFIDLLKINDNFELDSTQYSPKLVDFFKGVKAEFLDIIENNNEIESVNSEVQNNKQITNMTFNNEYNTAVAKSIILPGWGHLQLNENTKGWILTSVSTITLGSMIYFIIDANSKENDYLSQTDPALIQQKYDEYNKSYKIRNTLIAAYAAVWLYSQIDVLFFSNELGSKNISIHSPNLDQKYGNRKVLISFNIPF